MGTSMLPLLVRLVILMFTGRLLSSPFRSWVGGAALLVAMVLPVLQLNLRDDSATSRLSPHSPILRSGLGSHATSPSARVSFDTLRAVSRHVVRRTNEVRQERALSPLKTDSALASVACAHNADMFRRDFFEHINPDGETPQDRVSKMHRRFVGGVGENLYSQDRFRKKPRALGEQMVNKWMDSPAHRKNILNTSVTHFGVCVLQRGSALHATQVFGKVVGYLRSPLPRTVSPGAVLPVSFSQTFPPGTVIARYDFLDPRTDRRLRGPTLFTDSLRIPDTTGTVRPRFHILGTGEYDIYRGPDLIIRNASDSSHE